MSFEHQKAPPLGRGFFGVPFSRFLQQVPDGLLDILDGLRTSNDVVAPVYQEELGHGLHIVDGEGGRVGIGLADTDPRQSCRLLLPEVLIGVEADLIDLEALVVKLVIEFAQQQDTRRRLVGGKDVEVEEHHLAVEVFQMACQ